MAGLPFILVYLYDNLVASPDLATHQQHLRKVLRRLRENDLTINPLKSVFGQEEVKFMGHQVSASESNHSLVTCRTFVFPHQYASGSLLWSQPKEQAFNVAKSALAATTELKHP